MQFRHFAQALQTLSQTTKRLEITAQLASLLKELTPEEIQPSCYLLQGRLTPGYESLDFQLSVKMVLRALARIKVEIAEDGINQSSDTPSNNSNKGSITTGKDSRVELNLFGEEDDTRFQLEVERAYKKIGDLGQLAEEVIGDLKGSQGTIRGNTNEKSGKTNNETNNETNKYPQKDPSVLEVYNHLLQIARENGTGSQERKLAGLVTLLQKLDGFSAKYVVRIILGRMRLGFSDMTMLDALSWAMTGGKTEHDPLEEAYQKRADIGWLAQQYLQIADSEQRLHALQETQVKAGVPIMSALCQRLNSTEEMIEKMKEVYAEPKYDGLRVQIHVQKAQRIQKLQHAQPVQHVQQAKQTQHVQQESDTPRHPHAHTNNEASPSSNWKELVANEKTSPLNSPWQVRTFTRNLEETTHMFPELIEEVQGLACDSCILDAEAIGYDRNTDEFLPFQLTITRKRKHDIGAKSQEVPLLFFVFDILSLDGKSLIETPLRERRAILTTLFQKSKTTILRQTEAIQTTDPVQLRHFHEKCLAEGLEGMVVKSLDGGYQSGRKGWSWVKIKEEEGQSGKLSDTIDALVMGYYMGRGKRTQFGLGAFLVGVMGKGGSAESGQGVHQHAGEANTGEVHNEDNADQILTIAKIGTGLTDEQFRELKTRCDRLQVPQQPATYHIHKMLKPDVYIMPGLVVEVAADEITHSPVHTAGLALRFPRLKRFRDDKRWQDVTTTEELRSIAKVSTA